MLTRGNIETYPKYYKIRHTIWRSADLDSGIFDAQFGSKLYQVYKDHPPVGTHILYDAPKAQSGLRIFMKFVVFTSVV